MIHADTATNRKESSREAVQGILKAANFAAQRHAGQKRKGAAAEPYVNHLIEVAHLISTALPDADTNLIMAALLHDSVEDAAVKRSEIEELFGIDVADLVMEVTDDKSLPKAERKRLQIVNAPKKSIRAQAIKLADKISNLRAILHSPPADWTAERKQEYVQWAKQVVDALPNPDPTLKAKFEETYREFGQDAAD